MDGTIVFPPFEHRGVATRLYISQVFGALPPRWGGGQPILHVAQCVSLLETILALAVFSLPDRASRLELFTYCGRFPASGSEPEALSVSLPTEQRRPLDLL